ncbi:MOSC domain-containing protein [Pseudomonas aeruginosa]|nr:MOSC domain-containing protein [Pseudomonas aeruginosa]
MPLPALPLDALLTGRARPFTRPGSRSGIAKSPRDGALRVTPVGLEGDEQGDLRVHGGVEKAIHHYPREHYAAWIAELGEHPLLMQAGAFGENFSTSGWSEADVCLGDRVRAGTALLEVSQGRMPCWKLNDRFEVAGMSLRVQESGRTGWYYRVLEEGVVAAGDILQLVERRHPDWSLLRLSEVLFDRRAGSMSMVGPRPHATATKAAGIPFEEAVSEYSSRHRVKPGITGWAQINGYRGETDTLHKIKKRVEYDLEYIAKWSVWFDLYILFRTVPAVLLTKEVY